MSQFSTTPPEKDPQLWELAQRRVAFKYHLYTYIIVNTFFWILWYLSDSEHKTPRGWPWPVWPMIGWGIGLLFHYLGAYVFPKQNSVEREYEKLKNQYKK